jgi:predicted nucleic acid-binding protein
MVNKIPLVLDTCVLYDWDFLKWLSFYHEKKIISSIVYMEFSAQMLNRKKEHYKIKKILNGAGIEITSFDEDAAWTAAGFMNETGEQYYCVHCKNTNWNDCLIAAHAPLPPYVFVTENVKDFYSLLGEKRVKTPNEIMYPGRKFEEF